MCTDIDKKKKKKKREKSCQTKILFQTIDKDAQHMRLVHATMKHLNQMSLAVKFIVSHQCFPYTP